MTNSGPKNSKYAGITEAEDFESGVTGKNTPRISYLDVIYTGIN